MIRRGGTAGVDAQLAQAVRSALVDTLFSSPTSLAIGALTSSAASAAIAHLTRNVALIWVSIAISLLGALRVANLAIYRDFAGRQTRWLPRWELIYEAGAWGFSLLLGLMAYVAFAHTDSMIAQVLAAPIVVGYAGGISGRNAGRPAIAIGQVMLSAAPLAIGLLVAGNSYFVLLGVVVLLFILSLTDTTVRTYDVVLRAFTATHEKSQLADRFRTLARTDALTGLDNRTTFQQRLEEELAALTGEGRKLAVVWLDLDRFKEVNDTLGHSVGDELLVIVSGRLAERIEERGWLARYGGDEFVLIAPVADRAEAEELVFDLLGELTQPAVVDGNTIEVTGSIGAAIAPDDGSCAETVMQRADLALYHAKNSGRNRFSFFETSMNAKLVERRDIESGLRHALERGEFEVYYQPVVDLSGDRVVSCEALLRWFHGERGPVSPAVFIPVAETMGLIDDITEWVLREACTAAMRWRPDITIAVNISPVQLRNPRLPLVIMQTLVETGLPAHRLELEITESVFINENEQTNAMLRELQRIGLRLALDDFGTGYSSLSYLLKYSFNKIKIDGSFVANLERSRAARAIIEAVVGLADRLGMETVAEGIETEEQIAYVRSAGCGLAQGYHYARPMPRDQVDERLAQAARPRRRRPAPQVVQGRAAVG